MQIYLLESILLNKSLHYLSKSANHHLKKGDVFFGTGVFVHIESYNAVKQFIPSQIVLLANRHRQACIVVFRQHWLFYRLELHGRAANVQQSPAKT